MTRAMMFLVSLCAATPALAQTPPSDLPNAPFQGRALVPFERQLASTDPAPVTLLNTFYVAPERAAGFQAQWQAIAEHLAAQPGFVSTRMHRGIEGSPLWVNIAVWRSTADFRAALASDGFRRLARDLPEQSFRQLYRPID